MNKLSSTVFILFISLFCIAQKKNNSELENYLTKLEFYRYTDRLDSAQYYFRKALPIALQKKDSMSVFRAYKKLGDAYEHARKFDSTLIIYEKSRIYIPKKNLLTLSFFLGDKAFTYQLIGDRTTSAKLYTESYKIAEKINNKSMMASSLHNLGEDYDYLGLYKKATECFEKSIALATEIKHPLLIATGHRYNASTLIKQKKFKEAYFNLKNAEKIYLQKNDSISLAYTWAIFSDYYWAIGDKNKSFSEAQKAQKEWEKRNEVSDLITLYLTQGKHYIEIKDLEKAQIYLSKLEKINITENIVKKELFENLAVLNELKGKNATANQYLKKTIILQDTIQKEQNRNQLAAIRLKYDSDKKELEILKIKDESQAKTKQQYYILTITFLLIVLVFILYYAYQKNKSKNIEISKSLERSEVLLQEIHHRVKNNLALLSSLFYLQAKATKTEEAKQILNECQLRIESMSLVHQNLYDINNNEKVDFEKFLKQLFEKTSSAFNRKINEINFIVLGNKIEINLSKAIDLGIIINELTTNSLKYAFVNQNKPEIKVTIDQKENNLEINFSDNGVGMDYEKIKSNPGFGLKIITILVSQLNGTIIYEYENQISNFKIKMND